MEKKLLFAINHLQQTEIDEIIGFVADLNKEAIQLYFE